MRRLRGPGKPYKGLVNGVLRALQREETIEPIANRWRRDHPEWLRILLHRQYGKAALNHEANNRRAHDPTHQPGRHPSGSFQRRLRRQTFHLPMAPGRNPLRYSSLRLPPTSLLTLGKRAVRDQAAQHAAHLVMSAIRHRSPNPSPVKVLDACAAPGGKLFHLRSIDPRAHCSLPVCSRQQTNATAKPSTIASRWSCHSRPCQFTTANRIYRPDGATASNRPAFSRNPSTSY